jgi:hypothetical protein
MTEVRKPFEYAVKNGVSTVILGGDLFDVPTLDHRYSRAMIKVLLEFSNLEVYILLGNHDYEDTDSNSLHLITLCVELNILPKIKVITEKTYLTIEGLPFYFLPFPYVKFSKKCAVNIAHLEPSGARRDNGMLIKGGYSIDKNEAFIGHIHKKQSIGKMHLCGALYQTNFGEDSMKGWYHVETTYDKKKERTKSKIKFVKNICGFELVNLEINVTDDFDKIENNPRILYKLRLADGVELPKKLMLKYPNIVQMVGFKGGEERAIFDKQLPPEMFDGSAELDIATDPLFGLLSFLKNEGLDKKQRKRAIELIEVYLKQ